MHCNVEDRAESQPACPGAAEDTVVFILHGWRRASRHGAPDALHRTSKQQTLQAETMQNFCLAAECQSSMAYLIVMPDPRPAMQSELHKM